MIRYVLRYVIFPREGVRRPCWPCCSVVCVEVSLEKNEMVRICEVKWCENCSDTGHSIHTFPSSSKNKSTLRKWVKFVQVKRANFPRPVASSVLCQAHFKDSDFTNWGLAGSQRMGKEVTPEYECFPYNSTCPV